MWKASVNGQCATDSSTGAATVSINAGELKLKAAMSEAIFDAGPIFRNLSLSLEKPGSFIVDYNVPKQDLRFQFMNSIRVLDKQLKMTYTHSRADKNLWVDGTVVIDSSNKISATCNFDSGIRKFKYCYSQAGGARTFEPCYDVAKNSWDFSVSQRITGDDVVKGSYQTSTKILGLEWSRASPFSGSFKVSASLNLAEESKIPKLSAESTWDFDM
ncbi:outer envelope pore protein 24B, chloroplastic-like [Chenopodium quinoa]|uniref:outer envelope pore protein 24B, chloroplastic-like n=1 Tax=Chenopodium quinoa TaxID=63459 RepID=UPI000B7915FF|nr:outer envelope pore protein 24B, chloroplastic-like [Chenopodium quinoa]